MKQYQLTKPRPAPAGWLPFHSPSPTVLAFKFAFIEARLWCLLYESDRTGKLRTYLSCQSCGGGFDRDRLPSALYVQDLLAVKHKGTCAQGLAWAALAAEHCPEALGGGCP